MADEDAYTELVHRHSTRLPALAFSTCWAASRTPRRSSRKHSLDRAGRGIRWTSTDGEAGVRFDPLAAQHPQNPATGTIRAGPDPDRPTWAITASPHTPSSLLADLSETLAHETGTRRTQPGHEHRPRLAAGASAPPAVTAGRTVSRPR
ncbi:DUF317 domain-containing protein [Streptomyces sp. NPDC020571]|uniref:DUF317 domain-containing protein n=1 Tax=Streptomyces sp. NPDC020571 TaxID=3365079 RepID=UPI0037BC1E8B